VQEHQQAEKAKGFRGGDAWKRNKNMDTVERKGSQESQKSRGQVDRELGLLTTIGGNWKESGTGKVEVGKKVRASGKCSKRGLASL